MLPYIPAWYCLNMLLYPTCMWLYILPVYLPWKLKTSIQAILRVKALYAFILVIVGWITDVALNACLMSIGYATLSDIFICFYFFLPEQDMQAREVHCSPKSLLEALPYVMYFIDFFFFFPKQDVQAGEAYLEDSHYLVRSSVDMQFSSTCPAVSFFIFWKRYIRNSRVSASYAIPCVISCSEYTTFFVAESPFMFLYLSNVPVIVSDT